MSDKKVKKADYIVVSPSVLAKAFGLTDRRIRMLAEEGVIKRVGHGRYNFVESVQNYIVYLRTNTELKESKTDLKVDYEHEHALLEKAKREKAEIELKVMRGEVHLAEDVEQVMNDMLVNFRGKILSMPSKLSPMLVARDNVNNIKDIIEKNCFEVLDELKSYDTKAFYNDKYIDFEEIEEGEGGEEEENKA